MDELGADVDDARVVRREDDRGVPLVALGRHALGRSSGVVRLASGRGLAGREVLTARAAELALVIDIFGVPPVADDVEGVARGQVVPVGGVDAPGVPVLRRADPGAVVLGAAHDVVGLFVVRGDVVELLGADRRLLAPVLAAVPGLPRPAVVAAQDVVGVLRVDPHAAVVDVELVGAGVPARGLERLAAVGRDGGVGVAGVERLVVLGVDVDPAVVAGLGLVDQGAAAGELVLRHLSSRSRPDRRTGR